MNRSTTENRRSSKRVVITIDDDDSEPVNKKRETEQSQESMLMRITELEQKLAKSEKNFQGVCGMLREAQERVRYLENVIDTKPHVIEVARTKEYLLERKISELSGKLAQFQGLDSQQAPLSQQSLFSTQLDQQPETVTEEAGMYDSEESLFVAQISQDLTMTKEAEITEMKLQIKFTDVSKMDTVYSQPIELAGMTWKMRGVHKDKGLNFYLEAENKNQIDWCCPVFADFGVVSQKTKKIVDKSKLKEFFDARDHSRIIASIADKNLFNEKKAFVKNDSMSIAVDIRAYPRYLSDTTEISLRAKFNEISKLAKDSVYSEPTEHAGIMWKVLMFKNNRDRIVFNLNVQKKGSAEWACPVMTDFRLISQKTGEVIHIDSTKRIYDEERRTQWLGSITNAKLFNDEVGYVEDDSIMVDVVIKALPIN